MITIKGTVYNRANKKYLVYDYSDSITIDNVKYFASTVDLTVKARELNQKKIDLECEERFYV